MDRVKFANSLRGIAALCVLIFHYYGIFWLSRDITSNLIYAPILSDTINTPIVCMIIKYLLTTIDFNLGAFGVALFFLISGFVITFSLNSKSRIIFLINRFFRIIPVYFVGFSISLASLWLGAKYFGTQLPFTMQEILIHYIPGIRDILWSRNIDSIIWTLEIEIKFYIICALAIVWFKRNSIKVFLIPIVVFLLSSGMRYYITDLSYQEEYIINFIGTFIIFMFIGVVFNYLYRSVISNKLALFLIIFLQCLSYYNWYSGPYNQSILMSVNYIIAVMIFGLAYYLRDYVKENYYINLLADISYPLYVSHAMFGYVFMRIALEYLNNPYIVLIFMTVLAIVLAYIIHYTVEKWSLEKGKIIIEKYINNHTSIIAEKNSNNTL